MPVTIDDARAIAATLPRSYEALVRDRVKFRVGSMVYAAFSRDETIMGFGFPREEREALVASEPDKFLMPEPSDLRYRWVQVRLAGRWARRADLLVLAHGRQRRGHLGPDRPAHGSVDSPRRDPRCDPRPHERPPLTRGAERWSGVSRTAAGHLHRSTPVSGRHLLRHAHAPRVNEQLPKLVDVDGVEPDSTDSTQIVSEGGLEAQGYSPTDASCHHCSVRLLRLPESEQGRRYPYVAPIDVTVVADLPDIASLSSLRRVTPSLMKTFRRCHSTVRGLERPRRRSTVCIRSMPAC